MNSSCAPLARWLALLACLMALSLPASAVDNDVLGPGDSIRITVFENPDLTTETRVSSRGQIYFPLLGSVKVGGLTPAAAGSQIAKQLQEGGIIRNPQVNLSLLQIRSRQVSVLGQVTRPGRYQLDENRTTLTDVLALAGGIGQNGDNIVTVVRNRDGKSEKLDVDVPAMVESGDMSQNVEIENGDTVFVRRAPVFYIYGQVQRAGTYRMESGMTVMQAVTLGGGMTIHGTERGMWIARRTEGGGLRRLDVTLADRIEPDDIIHVQESFF